MKKVLILSLVIILLAVTLNPGIDITGFFVKASSALVTIARALIKEVLSIVIKVL